MAKLSLLIDEKHRRLPEFAISRLDFNLGQQPVIIGRAMECDIRLPASFVCRKQVAITFEDDRYFINVNSPLTTANLIPAKRNRRPVRNRDLLTHGDLIEIGIYRFRFEEPKHTIGKAQLDTDWLSPTVMDLARTIHELQAFDRLPILADALMDAGCDSEEIIQHCQGPGPHVKGCWVVDLLLGKD